MNIYISMKSSCHTTCCPQIDALRTCHGAFFCQNARRGAHERVLGSGKGLRADVTGHHHIQWY